MKLRSRIVRKDLLRPKVSLVVWEVKKSDGRQRLRDWPSCSKT